MPRFQIPLLALFASLPLYASTLPARQQTPAFRTRVEVVQLNVSVLDKNRQPVRGLTQKDFTILEDGKPQPIIGFSTFDFDDAPAPTTGWMRDVSPDVTTNELKESRLFVIVIDDGLIPQEPAMIRDSKKVVNSIIEKLSPDDLTAIVFTGDNRKTQDFTNDKGKLRAALDKFNPGLAGYRFGSETRVDVDLGFYQSAVSTLGSVADYLIAVPNRRKALFWVSPGVPMDLANCRPNSSRNPPQCGGRGNLLPPPEIWTSMIKRLDEVFRQAQRANVAMYPIDPGGLGGMRFYLTHRLGPGNELVAAHKATMQQDFLAMAAANTGGRTVMNTNDFEPGIRDIFAENASYYLIGFEPTNTKVDGKLRRIQVKVNRPGVDVRTRSGYYAPEPERPDKRKTAMTPEAEALAEAMGGILPVGDLPMRVSATPFAVPGQRLATVTIVLGVRQPVPVSAAEDQFTEITELQVTAFTPEGDPRGSQRHTAKVVLAGGADGEAAYEVLARIDLPAGRYRLRLAAHNAASKRDGSVFADVIVPDYSNLPVSAAPVVLAATPGRVSAPKDLLADVLPLIPTAERAFPITDSVTALFRLYQGGQKTVEPAEVTVRIRDSRDQVVAAETRLLAIDEFRVAANLSLRAADVTYQLPLVKLLTGPHLLTFEATVGTTTIRRDVQFEVK